MEAVSITPDARERIWHSSRRTRKSADEQILARKMRAAQEGDRSAYHELLIAVTPLLRRYILRRRRFLQRADVDDLVQEILLSLHSVRQTYDPARPFLPWLLAIAHHRLADAARRHAQRSVLEAAADDPVLIEAVHPRRHTEDCGDSKALRRALRKLPQRQRTAIQLVKLEERSLKEAAAQVGTTVGALKVSVHRAMTGLRQALVLTAPA